MQMIDYIFQAKTSISGIRKFCEVFNIDLVYLAGQSDLYSSCIPSFDWDAFIAKKNLIMLSEAKGDFNFVIDTHIFDITSKELEKRLVELTKARKGDTFGTTYFYEDHPCCCTLFVGGKIEHRYIDFDDDTYILGPLYDRNLAV